MIEREFVSVRWSLRTWSPRRFAVSPPTERSNTLLDEFRNIRPYSYYEEGDNQFVQTLTLKLLTYGLGRRTSYQDMPLVRSITRNAPKDGNRFSTIIVGIVESPVFQTNTKS